MTRGLTALALSLTCGVCRGGLLTNFAASYALYQQCAMDAADFDSSLMVEGVDFLMWQRGLGHSGQFINPFGDADRNGFVNQVDLGLWKGQYATPPPLTEEQCFKLFLDPTGIVAGSVTAIIDVPIAQAGQIRLAVDSMTRVIDVHPKYTAQLVQTNIIQLAGRQRLEAKVSFLAKDPTNPPGGPVTLFGFQAKDLQPQLGLQDIQVGFDFRPGDFVSIFDVDAGQGTVFDDGELNDVPLQLTRPLALDVNMATGAMSIRTPTTQPPGVMINYYEITSGSGSLNPGGWVSFDDTENGDPPGIGWEEAGGTSAKTLSESNLLGASVIEPGAGRSLGQAFKVGSTRDLRFLYGVRGCLIPGEVRYISTGSAAVPEPGCVGLALMAIGMGTGMRCVRRRRPS
jgi:hypothetical protein